MSTMDFPEPFEGGKPAEIAEPRPGRTRASKPDAAPRGGRQAPLQGRLQEAIGGIGIMVAMVNEVDGLAIVEGAERLSHALDKAAKQNPSVRRTLEAALVGGVWAEVAFASGAIVIPIALNHGMLPASLLGSFGSQNARNGSSPHTEPPAG